jgi:hypothetical protein
VQRGRLSAWWTVLVLEPLMAPSRHSLTKSGEMEQATGDAVDPVISVMLGAKVPVITTWALLVHHLAR